MASITSLPITLTDGGSEMIIDDSQGYEAFNKMIIDYDNNIRYKLNDISILAHPEETNVTNVIFIGKKYTFGIWVTPHVMTISDIGIGCLRFQFPVLDIDNVKELDYDENHIKISFGEGNDVKEIFLDLNNIENSYEAVA